MAGAISSDFAKDPTWPRKQRRVHHKVKTGCNACKARRHKCDEQRPTCAGCRRYSTECTYRGAAASSLANSHSLTGINLDDLELLHQWLTSTCIATGQLPEMTTHVQKTILPLAQAYPFVMRGIFAMAATQLAWLRPSRREHYTTLATRNHQYGLSDFRAAVQNINQKNHSAVISYAKSLLWCSFAVDPTLRHTRNTTSQSISLDGENWLPEWFRLLRGSCHVVEFSRGWIKEGPHALANMDGTADDYYNSEVSDDFHMRSLISQMQPLMAARSSCKTVFLALRAAFARASMHHHNTPLRNAINFWVAALPDDYFALLRTKQPWALIALAHLCILVHRLEVAGFMMGHASRLVLAIRDDLDADSRRQLQWPCREVGLET